MPQSATDHFAKKFSNNHTFVSENTSRKKKKKNVRATLPFPPQKRCLPGRRPSLSRLLLPLEAAEQGAGGLEVGAQTPQLQEQLAAAIGFALGPWNVFAQKNCDKNERHLYAFVVLLRFSRNKAKDKDLLALSIQKKYTGKRPQRVCVSVYTYEKRR